MIAILMLLTIPLGGCISVAPRQVAVSETQAAEALSIALSQLGKPYTWGGRGPDDFDCSGLITWAYKRSLRRDAIFRVGNQQASDATMQDLWQYNIMPLLPADMLPGDIVFITEDSDRMTHGGLFVRWVGSGEFEFINASSYHGQVAADTWPVNGTKREQWFVGAGRLKVAY